jgi:hypothetical protein
MIDHWLDDIEAQVRTVLKEHGPLSARELGLRLGVSEASAVSFIGLLASSGQLVIERVSCPREHGTADTETWQAPWRSPREAEAAAGANRHWTRRCGRLAAPVAAGGPCRGGPRVRERSLF